MLTESWACGAELQADNDMDYAEGTLKRAESHFKSIEATAAVHQARELKNISRWQSVLAILGIVVAGIGAYFTWVSVKSSGVPPTGRDANPPSSERRQTP